jgi:hypothetical protein
LEGKQNLVLLCLRQQSFVQHELVHQPDAAPPALLGVDGDAGGGKRVNVPIDGPLRHLQPLGQIPGGNGPFLHQKVEDLKEAAVLHQTVICPSTWPMGWLMARPARPS